MPLANIQGKFIVRTGGGGLTVPSTPSISSVTGSGFTVSWTAVTEAIGYRLDISTNSNFNSFVAGYNSKAVSGTSEVVTGLSSETTYYVRLKTVGVSANSGSVSETTEAQTSTLTNGLLAFYKLSDTSDSSGNGNTLTNNGGVTFSSGKIGNAAVFSEPEQSLERLIPLAVGPKSFSFWFRRSAQISGGGYSNYTYLLLNFNEGTPNAALTMRDDGTLMEISNTVNYNDDIWHHYCASITTGATTQYIDGSIVQNEGAFLTADTASDKTALRNSLGFANGNIDLDAVGIWSRALTSAEVAELYNAGTGLEIN